jgi:uncharacterized protein (DUF2141 family)
MKCAILLCLSMIGQTGHPQNVTLLLTVNNLKTVSGVVVVGVYNREKDFPIEGKEFRKLFVEVHNLTASCAIPDLPRGDYAIAIFHDQNADGICNLGLFGIPKEGFGFSKNFSPKLRAPDFNDCRIAVRENQAITINLIFR